MVLDASITVSLGSTLDADGIIADAAMSNKLRSAIDALARAAREARPF
jgi:hypothetical protein